jgi:metal-responsive CopG/Arc/MetJ family transcriptional regulator
MRIGVSIPEELFARAVCLARKTRKSKSKLFSDALREYIARHGPDEITEAMNKACSEIHDANDAFVTTASRHILESNEW